MEQVDHALTYIKNKMKKFIEYIPILKEIRMVFNYFRKSETLKIALTLYLILSLMVPLMLTLGLVSSFILGVGLDLNWFVESICSYYWNGEVIFTTGIPARRGHLFFLFLCWIFSIIIQDTKTI